MQNRQRQNRGKGIFYYILFALSFLIIFSILRFAFRVIWSLMWFGIVGVVAFAITVIVINKILR